MRAADNAVLVVEDLPLDAKLIERAFRKARIANPLHFVIDGEQACQFLAAEPPFEDRRDEPLPVLVLLDLKLPRRDGFEVLQWIRQQPRIRRIPVVVLTSSDRTGDINRAYELGANSYLVKPVELDALVEMLRTLELYWLILNEPPGTDDLESDAADTKVADATLAEAKPADAKLEDAKSGGAALPDAEAADRNAADRNIGDPTSQNSGDDTDVKRADADDG